METVAASGHAVIASPLLYQGGDLLAVVDPSNGDRVLFIGEAEIHRNAAVGLTRDQILEAFRIEFSVSPGASSGMTPPGDAAGPG